MLTSQEFNKQLARARTEMTIAEALSQDDETDFEFEPTRVTDLPREINIS